MEASKILSRAYEEKEIAVSKLNSVLLGRILNELRGDEVKLVRRGPSNSKVHKRENLSWRPLQKWLYLLSFYGAFAVDLTFDKFDKLRSSTPASLGLPTWRGYQADFNGHWVADQTTRSSSIVLSFHWGQEEPPGVARRAAIVWLDDCNERSTFALEFCSGFVAVGTF